MVYDRDVWSCVCYSVHSTGSFPPKASYWVRASDFYNKAVGNETFNSLWNLVIGEIFIQSHQFDKASLEYAKLINLATDMNLLIARFDWLQQVVASENRSPYLLIPETCSYDSVYDCVLSTLHEV